MSLDDLITLLLVVLFVGAPLLQRFLGRGSGSQQPGEGDPGRPGRTRPGPEGERPADTRRAEQTAEAQRRPESRTTGTDERTDGGASELERRIAEARRRVQEARGGSSAQSGAGGSTSGSGAQPAGRPLVSSRPTPQAFLGREGGSTEGPQAGGFLGREGVRDEPKKRTAPLQVAKRTRKPRASTLSAARGVVSLRRDDILNGFIWHQILSEPVSARNSRRKPSRDR